jgi:hypothetical protein
MEAKMLSDPLFIKTQNELQNWRENKKSPRDHIPTSIKDNIKKLNLNYPKSKLRSALDLSGCSLAFLKESKSQIKKIQDPPAHFIELPSKSSILVKEKISSRIEIELPMGITLRIFQ